MRRILAYRLPSDDASSSRRRVTAALEKGRSPHGRPACAFNAARGVMRCGREDPAAKLGEL
jgi:hypothetical protein